jgi:hypothetical protein
MDCRPYDHAAIVARGHALGFAYDQFPFLYPPPFAIAAEALARLSFPQARQVWMLLATLALFGALAATVDLVRRQAAAVGIVDRRYVWILLAAFFPSALNSTSVHNDVRAGSVGCMLFLCLALAARELVPPVGGGARRSSILGGSLAAAALLKLTPAALLAWAGRRRAWRAAWIGSGLLGSIDAARERALGPRHSRRLVAARDRSKPARDRRAADESKPRCLSGANAGRESLGYIVGERAGAASCAGRPSAAW